jgi:type I restriction enzyme R subunit
MSLKEAKARIKINKLLEEAGWRFFDEYQYEKDQGIRTVIEKLNYSHK